MSTNQTHSHPFNIANPNFNYTPANKTNVMDTYKRHGFVPPTTIKGYFAKRRKQLLEDMSYEESNAATQYGQTAEQPF